MAGILINLAAGEDPREYTRDTILIKRDDSDVFYSTTRASFFEHYDKKQKLLLAKYEEKIKRQDAKIADLTQAFKDFTGKVQKSNAKLIELVENFIKENQ